MHSYPAWKVWLVAIVLLVAACVRAAERVRRCAGAATFPQRSRGGYGGRPRVGASQRSPAKNIPIEASYLSEDRLVLRFHMVEQQLEARDVLQESMGERLPGRAVARAAYAGLDASHWI